MFGGSNFNEREEINLRKANFSFNEKKIQRHAYVSYLVEFPVLRRVIQTKLGQLSMNNTEKT